MIPITSHGHSVIGSFFFRFFDPSVLEVYIYPGILKFWFGFGYFGSGNKIGNLLIFEVIADPIWFQFFG